MKVADQLRDTKDTLFSFELLPPLKGRTLDDIYQAIDPLIEFNPLNINITYHQQESIYRPAGNGLMQRTIVRKRPGTVAIGAALKYKYKLTIVPHMICGGFSKLETEDVLIDLHFLGMKNLLVLRGDAQKGYRDFIPEKDGHEHTIGLVNQIMNLNKGIYLDAEVENATKLDFSIGVAGYPEKHFEAPNLDEDIKYLKAKVDAGAEYVVTQLFYNNAKFFEFVELCRKAGIKVPIIPGIKPITTMKDVEVLPRVFHIGIPNDLVKEVQKCSTNAEAKEVGVEWAIQQSLELKKAGVPAIHFYTIGISDNIRKIAARVF
jgi:methylenetetrahydrofolate reductase (NADPH)